MLCLFLVACSSTEEPEPKCAGTIEARSYPDTLDTTFPVGPILLHTTEVSTTILWETETASCAAGVVLVGEQRFSAMVDGTIQKAEVTGLQANSKYDYRVSACGKETGALSFYTAPSATTPVRFGLFGDTQSHPERSTHAVAGMKKAGAFFLAHAGDEVGDGHDRPSWRTELFDPLRQFGHYAPMYSAIGNHEANADAYYDYSAYPYPEALVDHSAAGANYAFSFGNVYFVVIDTNNLLFLASPLVENDVSKWIRKALKSEEAQKATWRFAMAHHGAFTESWGHCTEDAFTGLPQVKDWLFPLLAEHSFHAYFAGHTHAYERGKSQGVLHVISGGGGGDLDQRCRDVAEIEVVEIKHHYLVVDAECNQLVLRAYEAPGDGTPFDEVVLAP